MAEATTMRAAVMDRFGPPDVLRVTELPVPEPGHGEVLVAVHAAAVNAIDWKTRAGRGVPVERFPAVLGSSPSWASTAARERLRRRAGRG
jgi:NADPH:quinone reductase-like Zn-dependent oxidoreductase